MHWFGCLLFVVVLNAYNTKVPTRLAISIQTYRPHHPEYQWLQRFLRLQGYHPIDRAHTRPSLSLQLLSPALVLLQKGRYTRQYKLPPKLRSPQLRARMATMYLALFLEAIRTGHITPQAPKNPAKARLLPLAKTTTPQVSTPTPLAKAKARSKRATTSKKAPDTKRQKARSSKQRRLKPRKKRFALARRSARTKEPASQAPDKAKRKLATARKVSRVKSTQAILPGQRENRRRGRAQTALPPSQRPALRRTPALPHSSPRTEPQRPLPQRPLPQRPLPQRPTVRRTTTRRPTPIAQVPASLTRPLPVASQPRIWGDVLSLDLGISGGFRWSNFARMFGGGELLLGFNVWRWTLRVDLSLHTFHLRNQNRIILLVRPSFWLGWRVPMGSIERALQLHLLAGIGTELSIQEQTNNSNQHTYATQLQWGILLGAQLHWWFAPRWSLFLRPALYFFPGNLGTTIGQVQESSQPPIQLGALLGFQVRL